MTDNSEEGPASRRGQEPSSINHLIWGMTSGLLIGTALAYFLFDNVAVGVAIGIVLGAVFAMILSRALR